MHDRIQKRQHQKRNHPLPEAQGQDTLCPGGGKIHHRDDKGHNIPSLRLKIVGVRIH